MNVAEQLSAKVQNATEVFVDRLSKVTVDDLKTMSERPEVLSEVWFFFVFFGVETIDSTTTTHPKHHRL